MHRTTKITYMYLTRVALGLTQNEVAEAVGVSQPRYSNIEGLRDARASEDTLEKIADVLRWDKEPARLLEIFPLELHLGRELARAG